MRRITDKSKDELIEFNLRDGGNAVTVFADSQSDRISRTRATISRIISEIGGSVRIVEPGCSAGDLSGPFSKQHDVLGIDVVPAAVDLTISRYPDMMVTLADAERMEPIDCDILVLCEFLEHLDNPADFVVQWLPKARYAVISHPLVGHGDDHEEGHSFAYDLTDFKQWFTMGGHELVWYEEFPMYYHMVQGYGKNLVNLY